MRLRNTCATLIPAALVAGLLGASPASADEATNPLFLRSLTVRSWESGDRGIKEQAEKALLGSDDDIKAFVAGRDKTRDVDDRVAVSRMINFGGRGVRAAGTAALASGKPEDVQAFLTDGWKAPLDQDRRVEVSTIINAGGRGVQLAGTEALKGTPEDVKQFLEVGQYKARETDDRVAVSKLINFGGPAMQAAGTVALQGTPDDVREFLEIGQFTARNRDQETATLQQLLEQAKLAGAQADVATKEAEEASARAVTASDLAKQAAQTAANEAAAANIDSKTAAKKAQQAAEAAMAAAEASQQAIQAANAANRSARVAALAAAQTSAAASAAADAASRAYDSSVAALGNASQADKAKNDAAAARKAGDLAKQSGIAAERAAAASRAAATAVNAALSAAGNSDDAADAADQADKSANAAGAHSNEAHQAAVETRRHAAEANRAAQAAMALANKAADAATEARDAANSAAGHANKAADAAEEAVKHAGEAGKASAQSAAYATAAAEAATSAENAAATSGKVFGLAREVDAADLTTRTNAAIERAKSQKTINDSAVSKLAKAALEGKAIDDDTTALAAEADKPGADTKAIAGKGRAIAMRAMKSFGSWRQSAAAQALAGSDDDVLTYLRTGVKKASSDEIRQQVADLASQSPYEAVRTGAAEALKGSDQQIRDFYTTGQFQVALVEYRVLISKINNAGGPSVKKASQDALADGSVQALTAFLNTGQYQARNTDERVIASKLYNDGGPEVKAAAMVALTGPADKLHDFVELGQYMADRKDKLTDNHVAQAQRLLNETLEVAANARKKANTAAQAAALAKGAKDVADKAAAAALESAAQATKYAADAAKSADAAQASADQAAKSAATARAAADRASNDAVAADESAAQAQFSATYARQSADAANRSAAIAYRAKLGAGKSRDEAVQAAGDAWKHVADLRRAEEAEARRQAAEERKKQQEGKQKKPCIPRINWDHLPPCAGHSDYVLQQPNMDNAFNRFLTNVFMMVTPIGAVVQCAENPTTTECLGAGSDLALASKVSLAQKLIGKGIGAVEDLGKETRFNRGGNCTQCFLAGTKVLMADNTAKTIESVKVGDQVTATDPLSGKTGPRRVTALIVTEHDKIFNDLTIKTRRGHERLTATTEHPFWSPSQQMWVEAGKLTRGMTLRAVDGTTVEVEGNRSYEKNARTYNLTIDDLHTYYVLAGSTPILVHNSGPFCGEPIGGKIGDRLGGEDFHGSEYSLDEIVEFVNGHTGDGNPTMGRPTVTEIETALREAGPVRIGKQNAAQFDHGGVRVIVNYDMPWKSTAYYPGSLGKP
ncbi:polymorphic toxin-type HINT domain-containing protein [Streptomyces sp. BPTC-684]|uniref:polymorphic toxin-type HINT domain-containing protein n=1 Tax=Streptomyces sp. BPTC-684 TaxID=3043734 RepID=UPI0024B20900|nr:polymorphic toxin-type HINT domain-containing protein [Streptomyces sp. BPTC-684]WHM36621.1 polymorphic toxin-type HINT domain-containing protein [Streptomyces sp. BPTC-684]